ncbi:hypothetical protein J31TS4_21010 [Paenibacillus sp. J31TS4]|uniref:YezD family protein n=1 Tax=Paenibacillus sp. J31TS4 TaxID=2807195 RepID=UPI001B2465E6|nr:YezD family protein [Paenibacillus sp. J31TS4]GIP38821.1 hypothetical protein J31TS4_21010 [Paenibacillus sp. J31TS4]
MAKPLEVNEQWLRRIGEALEGIEYGSVHIVVHDGRIVQIERSERRRFDAEPEAGREREARRRNA